MTTFDEAGFPEYLLNTIKVQGFPSPTPIQCQAWPMALSGRDMVGIAQTGMRVFLLVRALSYLHSQAVAKHLHSHFLLFSISMRKCPVLDF